MYKLSKLAAEDFADIYEYTLLNFGARQADDYTDDLESTFQLLSSSPLMGHVCQEIADGVGRHDHQRHAIFLPAARVRYFYHQDTPSADATDETFL